MSESGDTVGLTKDRPGLPGTLIFENESVRVWELILKPKETCQWHVHELDHLILVTSGARILGERADGEIVELDIPDNQLLSIPASHMPETCTNMSSDRTLRELIIDLKPGGKISDISIIDFFSPGTPSVARPT